MNETPTPPRESYSPRSRTALVLTGTGTAGAYHAGVLRALQEAGVRIDVVCGRGMGAVSAMFAAVDGARLLWEPHGIWRGNAPAGFYRLRAPLRIAGWLAAAAGMGLAVPVAVLATGLLAYPLAFLVQMISPVRGHRLAAMYTGFVSEAFSPAMLPTIVPRLITLVLMLALIVLAAAAARPLMDRRAGRRFLQGPWWGRVLGSPWTASAAIHRFERSLWQLIRGPTALGLPAQAEISRRYAELLTENLGQPGFRELLVTAHDIDAGCDLIFAALAEPYRSGFLQAGETGRGRRPGETIDLAGVGREHALDAMAGALSLPILTESHLIAFSAESYWRGEAHRVCDRTAAASRLCGELSAAGVEQLILVSPSPDRTYPHALRPSRGDLRARASEHLAGAESAAVRDAVAARPQTCRGLFLIQPSHQPVGPLDASGAFDERSDRQHSLAEMIDRGYEDAYRQFIDPVLGAGGEAPAEGLRLAENDVSPALGRGVL
jgi:hypothetical protein